MKADPYCTKSRFHVACHRAGRNAKLDRLTAKADEAEGKWASLKACFFGFRSGWNSLFAVTVVVVVVVVAVTVVVAVATTTRLGCTTATSAT